MNKWIGSEVMWVILIGMLAICCGNPSILSLQLPTTNSDADSSNANNANTNTNDTNDDGDSGVDTNLPHVVPVNNGNGTFVTSNANFAMNVQAAFFDATNDANTNPVAVTVILTSDPNLCLNYDPNVGFSYLAKSQVAVFNLTNTDANFNTIALKTGAYSFDPDVDTGNQGTMNLNVLDGNCMSVYSGDVASAFGGQMQVSALVTNPNQALTAQGNFAITLGENNSVTASGVYNAMACGGLSSIFQSGSGDTCHQ